MASNVGSPVDPNFPEMRPEQATCSGHRSFPRSGLRSPSRSRLRRGRSGAPRRRTPRRARRPVPGGSREGVGPMDDPRDRRRPRRWRHGVARTGNILETTSQHENVRGPPARRCDRISRPRSGSQNDHPGAVRPRSRHSRQEGAGIPAETHSSSHPDRRDPRGRPARRPGPAPPRTRWPAASCRNRRAWLPRWPRPPPRRARQGAERPSVETLRGPSRKFPSHVASAVSVTLRRM